MQVKLITATPDAEKIIGYCARVSNPNNQDNPDVEGLLKYCARHRHWSIFEMANAVFEIETSRAIAAQILRHRSFSFQEFSQRYSSDIIELEPCEARRQDTKNRQNSIDDLNEDEKDWFNRAQQDNFEESKEFYNYCVKKGVAKECARMLLPLGTKTRLYMNGTMRSWIHYLTLRSANGTQLEHMDIANAIIDVFEKEWPLLHKIIKHQQMVEEKSLEISKKMKI